jgi:hypothetical protein
MSGNHGRVPPLGPPQKRLPFSDYSEQPTGSKLEDASAAFLRMDGQATSSADRSKIAASRTASVSLLPNR